MMAGHLRSGRLRLLLALLCLLPLAGPRRADAQPKVAAPAPLQRDRPAFYQADAAEYDRETGIVTLRGHVELWQNERILLADTVTYDRNTAVAAARGNVVLLEPDGQTVFADYAELGEGMKQGVLEGMRALLAENGRLAANGARRTDGRINELSRVVYSTCDLCAADPTRAPLWQIRAREAVQDVDNQMIEYHDAVLDFFGVPIFWTPYLTHPDPSRKRASGLLVPSFGASKHLGGFFAQPWYWVIDGQSDATITPMLAGRNGPALDVEYRHRFNNGSVSINASVANYNSSGGGHVFAKGLFAIDDVWRWGFDIQRASSLTYMRDFRVANSASLLTSQLWIEGFGAGAYTRGDVRAYQGLTSNVRQEKLPYVLPRYQYSLVTEPDRLGGRTSLDFGAFNVLRNDGTNTKRVNLTAKWERGMIGRLGEVWNVQAQLASAAYVAHQFDQQPNFGPKGTVSGSQVMPTLAATLRYPFVRDAGNWGSQIIEPIVQVIAAPRGSNYASVRIPNEDSLDQEFTDATLFSLNRFPGVDRLEGGMRANVALHAAWYLPSGAVIDAQVGQAYKAQRDSTFLPGSGLERTASDIVSHISFAPNSWIDLTSRQRFDNRTMQPRFVDASASFGPSWLKFNGGYLYSVTNPFAFYDTAATTALASQPRNEVTLGATTKIGNWSFRASGRRDVRQNKMVALGLGTSYEDECFIFDVSFFRRYTSIDNDRGSSTILFQLTFKTVGQFGFHAL
jgi:LPS-assembly protein